MNWKISDIENLQKAGKIRGFHAAKIAPGAKKIASGAKKLPKSDNRSKAKDWIEWNLMFWANEYAIQVIPEHRFHPHRQWRFDWAIPALMVAVEFEGGIYQAKSGHNTAKHYTKDTQKYNAAQAAGWTVLRYTAKNFQDMSGDLALVLKLKRPELSGNVENSKHKP